MSNILKHEKSFVFLFHFRLGLLGRNTHHLDDWSKPHHRQGRPAKHPRRSRTLKLRKRRCTELWSSLVNLFSIYIISSFFFLGGGNQALKTIATTIRYIYFRYLKYCFHRSICNSSYSNLCELSGLGICTITSDLDWLVGCVGF